MNIKTFKRSAAATALIALVLLAPMGVSAASANSSAASKQSQTQSQYIGVAAAKKVALKHAKVAESKAKFTKAKLERDDGRWIYDLEFTTSTTKYEYEVGAANSRIYEQSKKAVSNAKPAKVIGVEAAKKVALKHAKVSSSQASFSKAKLERDDGRWIYDLEFTTSTAKYEYEIGAADSKIYDKSKKTVSTAKPSKMIGIEAAKKVALKHAKLSVNQVTGLKAKQELEHGMWIYEVEFKKGRAEYDYEIQASNGKILDWECDRD